MKVWKKIIFVVITILLLNLTLVTSYEQAKASVVSKPLTITAKKVAKDLAKDSAVEMAERIVFEKLMTDYTNVPGVNSGYRAVCMDGAKSFDDCSPERRAQVKTTINSSDKNSLDAKVEQVLEQKTNTSTKWGKFLDFFVPIFLISGVVAFFDAQLDGDSESFIDEIALQALIDAGLLKPLKQQIVVSEWNPKDFSGLVQSVRTYVETGFNGFPQTVMELQMLPGKSFVLHRQNDRKITVSNKHTFQLRTSVSVSYAEGTTKEVVGKVSVGSFYDGTANLTNGNPVIHTTSKLPASDANRAILTEQGINHATSFSNSFVSNSNDLNDVINTWFARLSAFFYIALEVPDIVLPEVITDYGLPKGVEGLKNPDGTVPLPGIDSFTYIYNNTYIYPTIDSTTGWKDKTTGEDIEVIEDEITVDEQIGVTDPGDEDGNEEVLACSRNLEKIDFKRVGVAFTNAFPFSIPWDIKRFIDNALVGVGSEKPSFNLAFLGDGVTLEIPSYFDGWLPFVHGLIIILFDVSLVYLFYRFMKGGGD